MESYIVEAFNIRKNIINTYYVVDESNTNNAKEINTFSLPFTPNFSYRINF